LYGQRRFRYHRNSRSSISWRMCWQILFHFPFALDHNWLFFSAAEQGVLFPVNFFAYSAFFRRVDYLHDRRTTKSTSFQNKRSPNWKYALHTHISEFTIDWNVYTFVQKTLNLLPTVDSPTSGIEKGLPSQPRRERIRRVRSAFRLLRPIPYISRTTSYIEISFLPRILDNIRMKIKQKKNFRFFHRFWREPALNI